LEAQLLLLLAEVAAVVMAHITILRLVQAVAQQGVMAGYKLVKLLLAVVMAELNLLLVLVEWVLGEPVPLVRE